MADTRQLKLITFNCKDIKKSMECVRGLCNRADVIALQETWLLPHDIPLLGDIHSEFIATGVSAVDTGAGPLRGRPHGGVALLWRRDAFSHVKVVQCNHERICAIKVSVSNRSFMVVSAYLPTDCSENLVLFTDCMSAISAIVESEGEDSVYVLGDFNAHPGRRFGDELLLFCKEQQWLCADIEKLGIDSGCNTYVSEIHGTHSWLDHCLDTKALWDSVLEVRVCYSVYWSDHYPLFINCDLDILKCKKLIRKLYQRTIFYGGNEIQIKLVIIVKFVIKC